MVGYWYICGTRLPRKLSVLYLLEYTTILFYAHPCLVMVRVNYIARLLFKTTFYLYLTVHIFCPAS